MHDHPHPGELFEEDVLAPLDLSITEASQRLGMSRVALSRVVNGKAGISSDLAVRLERAGIATARFWMTLQTNYELQQAHRREQPSIEPWSPRAGSTNDHDGSSKRASVGRGFVHPGPTALLGMSTSFGRRRPGTCGVGRGRRHGRADGTPSRTR